MKPTGIATPYADLKAQLDAMSQENEEIILGETDVSDQEWQARHRKIQELGRRVNEAAKREGKPIETWVKNKNKSQDPTKVSYNPYERQREQAEIDRLCELYMQEEKE